MRAFGFKVFFAPSPDAGTGAARDPPRRWSAAPFCRWARYRGPTPRPNPSNRRLRALTLLRPRSYTPGVITRSSRGFCLGTPLVRPGGTGRRFEPTSHRHGEIPMEATKTRLVDYRVKNGVAWIELTDPPANTYTYEMMRDLDDAILQARFDENVHVVVLRGAGEKFFCAGANINMLKTVNPTFKYYFCLHANETLNRLEHTPKLVIAALNGHTVGGGLEIALAADLRIARKGAGKIGLPEVALGVLPGTGGTMRLSKIVGKSKAIELMVTGNTFSFEEAHDLGLVNQIIDATPEDWWQQIMDYARQFVPPNKASKAVGRIKRAVQTGWDLPAESALAVERELQQLLFQSEDAKEGIAANQEKRVPKFKGR